MANFCIYCGNPVAEKDGFCRTCGRKLLNTPETTQPKSAASASGTAQNTGRSIPRAAQMLVGYTRKISFPEGQREVSIELIPGAGSSAGSAAVLTNIRNPFLTLLGGFRTLISGFPKTRCSAFLLSDIRRASISLKSTEDATPPVTSAFRKPVASAPAQSSRATVRARRSYISRARSSPEI